MSEKLPVLAHHVKMIKEGCYVKNDKSINLFEAEACVRGNMYKTVVDKFGGGDAYPNLDQPDNFRRAVNARVIAAEAVLNGEYISIPDHKPDGSRNFDLICFACTNFIESIPACRLDELVKKYSNQ